MLPHTGRYVTYRGMRGDIEPPEFKGNEVSFSILVYDIISMCFK